MLRIRGYEVTIRLRKITESNVKADPDTVTSQYHLRLMTFHKEINKFAHNKWYLYISKMLIVHKQEVKYTEQNDTKKKAVGCITVGPIAHLAQPLKN